MFSYHELHSFFTIVNRKVLLATPDPYHLNADFHWNEFSRETSFDVSCHFDRDVIGWACDKGKDILSLRKGYKVIDFFEVRKKFFKPHQR